MFGNKNKKEILISFLNTVFRGLILLLFLKQSAFALTEQEFIKKVLSQDTYFEKDQIYVDIKQIELDTSMENYAGWNTDLTVELDNSYYKIDKDTTSTSIYEKQRHKNSQSIKLSTEKKFLSNPSILTLSVKRATPDVDITRYKQDELYTGSNAQYSLTTFDNTYNLNYKYPLLKHDSNATSLKSYWRNILDLEREKLDFYDSQQSFLVDRLEQYLLWSLYEENADIYTEYLQTIQEIKTNKEADKNKLKIAIFRGNKDILDNDSKLQAQKKALVVDLQDESLLGRKPQIDYAKQPNMVTINLDKYLQQNVRSLLKYDIDKNLKKIDIEYYENQSLAQLDLEVSAEKNTNIGNTLTTNYDNSSMEYSSNLTFSIPIGDDVSNKEDLAVAKLNLRKLQIDYDDKLKDVKSDAEALEVELKLNKKALYGYKDAIKNITNNIKTQHNSYTNHLITIKDLLDAYKEKRDVKLEYIAQVIGYQQNILEYNDKLDRVIFFKHEQDSRIKNND